MLRNIKNKAETKQKELEMQLESWPVIVGDLRWQGKLSGRSDNADVIWAGKGILATSTGDRVVRSGDFLTIAYYIIR